MNAQARRLQRRGQIGIIAFVLFSTALVISVAAGPHILAWCAAPLSAASLTFTLGTIVLIERAREQARRTEHDREQAALRRRRLRTLSAPDAPDGQCPVCGYGDLDELAERDRFLEESGAWRRVAEYGARRAHQECAELVPYKKPVHELAVEEHELNHHGAASARMVGCPLCAQETREQIANDPDVGRPIWPPLGITHAELSQRLTNLFSVPPADVGPMRGPLILPPPASYTPLKDTRPTQSVSGLGEGLLSADEVRRLRLRLPRLPDEKGESR